MMEPPDVQDHEGPTYSGYEADVEHCLSGEEEGKPDISSTTTDENGRLANYSLMMNLKGRKRRSRRNIDSSKRIEQVELSWAMGCCCRFHGQHPRRHRSDRHYRRRQHRQRLLASANPHRFLLLRGGTVMGSTSSSRTEGDSEMASGNRRETVDSDNTSISFRFFAQDFHTTSDFSSKLVADNIRRFDTWNAYQALMSQYYTNIATPNSYRPQHDGLSQIKTYPCWQADLKNTNRTSALSQKVLLPQHEPKEHYVVSRETCSIEQALSFCPRARLLLESHAPHRVIHHNAAYEFFRMAPKAALPLALSPPSWGENSTSLDALNFGDLTDAVNKLFVDQLVTMYPVLSKEGDSVTHYLLELSSESTAEVDASKSLRSSEPKCASELYPTATKQAVG